MQPSPTAPDNPKPSRESENPVTVAYRQIVRLQAEKLHERAAEVRATSDIEAVHRLRVTTRRMRSALRLMQRYFKPKQMQPIRAGASDLAQRLGAVRDLDVALEHLQAYADTLPPERRAGLAPLLRDWQTRRQRGYWDLVGWLNAEEYRQWLALVMEFAQQSVDKDAPRVCDVLPQAIWKQYATMRAYEPHLADAPLTELHALRIEAKRMRYMLEFFADALGADGKAVIEALTVCQDALGKLHDTDAIRQLVSTSPSGEEMTAYTAALTEEEARLRHDSLMTFGLVTDQPFRVLLGLAVANL